MTYSIKQPRHLHCLHYLHPNQLSQAKFKLSSAWLRFIFTLTIIYCLSACEAITYYPHIIIGHLKLQQGKIPIEQALDKPELTQAQKNLLHLVPQIKTFASEKLLLPNKQHYDTIVFIDRPHVVWNVLAAPSLSLEPKTWCFPIAGCVSYRGYFQKVKAEKYAASLQKQGLDVYLSGAAAYSTLGWFEDPLINTFLKYQEADLIGLLFHELAHQKLYVKNDSTFNESFATAVQIAGVKLWFEALNQPKKAQQYLQAQQIRHEFIEIALSYKERLNDVYRSQQTDQAKALEKAKILEAFRQAYSHAVVTHWSNKKPFYGWMQGPLNNAQWNSLGTYYDLVKPLQAKLAEFNNDFEQFYHYCAGLADQEKAQRHHILRTIH